MKTLHPLSLVGTALGLLGLALCYSEWAVAGPWVALAGVFVAEKGIGKAASVGRAACMLGAGWALGVALAVRGHALLGLGVVMALWGHAGRLVLISYIGTLGYWYLEPVVAFAGLALAVLGAWQAQAWPLWGFVAFATMQAYAVYMGMGFSAAIAKRTKGGWAVEPGRPAPDFTLSDESGFPISLASFRERSPVLLIFVRGDWCPSCHITLRTHARHKDRFQEKGITLLAVGPDPVGVNLRMVQDLSVPYKMLSDEGQKTAMAYGVQFDDAMAKGMLPEGIPLPASFLVDKAGVVRYTSRPDRSGEFLDPNTIFPSLQTLVV